MKNTWKKLRHDPIAVTCLIIIAAVILIGCFAPLIAPNDPNQMNPELKYAGMSARYPLGNDYLGRCVLSRVIYGIRPSVLLIMLAMLVTIGIGAAIGLVSGYYKGKVDEFFMRLCDIMLSFPSEVMILAFVGIFGVGLRNILLATVLLRWPWYARVFRTAVMKYTDKNYVQFARATGCSTAHILFGHLLPAVFPEIALIASNSLCSLILSVSGYSFLGLGVQAPTAEWGMMLSEAKNVMLVHPEQMLAPGLAIMLVCVSFAFLGDSLRDAMDAKHVSRRKQCRHSLTEREGSAAA